MKNHLIFIASIILSTSSLAQDSLVVLSLQQHIYTLELTDGQLSGPGANFLAEVAQSSPFFLIGENHGMAEMPLFTAAVIRAFHKYGYRYFATETGPYAAAYLEDLASTKDNWMKEFSSFLHEYPWSFPFYGWKEECAMLNALQLQNNSEQAILWGLDQEFAVGYRFNFLQLIRNAETEKSRELAQHYFDQALMAYDSFFLNKNPQASYLLKLTSNDFDTLKQVFAEETTNLDRIIELERSTHIYKLWFQGEGFQSNYLRAEMMKQHFWDYYSQARQQDDDPKVIFKFGSNHIYRGANGLNVFDIGNFVSELASQMETTSFHLYTLGRKGTQNVYNPFSESEADKEVIYDAKNYLDKVDFSPIFDAAPVGEWAIVDLRLLRKKLFNRELTIFDRGLEKVIWSYDAVLVIPEVHASTNIE